uniref:Protein lin-54 homolog n=1 Tax=Phallusia mammillata TaxID=59560 RepID=A0A6F9DJ07_9ASCI|nr:protein lin-54 homolog [Phallusia mammillata]
MEAFKDVSDLQDLYELDSGQQTDINMETTENNSDNMHDITDDALETMLMDEGPTQTVTENTEPNQAPTESQVIATTHQAIYKLAENKVVMSMPAVQVTTSQQKNNPPAVKRLMLKKPAARPLGSTNVSPQTIGILGLNPNASRVQTLTVQGNSFTLASPGKTNFKIPISPAKNSLKVSMITPNSNVVTNSIKTFSLNSSAASSNPQLQSKFQFQTLLPSQVNAITVGLNNQQKPQQTFTAQQPIQVSGERMPYLRLVPAGNEQNSAMAGLANIIPAPGNVGISVARAPQPKPQQFVTVQSVQRQAQQQVKTQRLIMPATTSIMPQQQNLTNLTPGTVLQAGNVGYAMVPAKYVEQLKKQLNSQMLYSDPVGTSSSETHTQPVIMKSSVNGKVKKPCNCTKSMCLKLYCECFANGHFCDGCNCINCHNNLEFDSDRSKAIKQCLDRNPMAFRPKIGRGQDDNRTHQKGCNCKRSGCLKNYCECYEARIPCTSRCKCIGCKNLEEDSASQNEQLSLMHLADAAAVRCQQQAAARSKISSHIGEMRSSHHRPHPPNTTPGERLPSTFFTQEVIEATCTCLLAQAEEAEKTNRSLPVAEMMILEEFGRCMMQIIQAAGKAKTNNQT